MLIMLPLVRTLAPLLNPTVPLPEPVWSAFSSMNAPLVAVSVWLKLMLCVALTNSAVPLVQLTVSLKLTSPLEPATPSLLLMMTVLV